MSEARLPVVFAWSGGKDSAFALYNLMQDHRYEVRYLLSTVNGNNGRLSMHGVREALIEAQAASIGIPLIKVYVYENSNAEYEQQMCTALHRLHASGIYNIAFGDIFLEDLRHYREQKMEEIGMDCLFPIWKTDTSQLIHEFLVRGFKTVTCCINDAYLDESWCGRHIDDLFLRELPASVDPCGENGEFHSFCFDGPIFKNPIPVIVAEKIYKVLDLNPGQTNLPATRGNTRGFWFCELLPERTA